MIEDNTFSVYIHELPDGRKYIGVTQQKLSQRFEGGSGYKYNSDFYNEIVKIGWKNIKHIVAASGLSIAEACALEIELIREFNTTSPKYGFNRECGGRHSGKLPKKMDKTTFGRNLSKSLERCGYSVKEFAQIIQIDVLDVEAYITGEKLPDIYTAAIIARVLHTTISKMIHM